MEEGSGGYAPARCGGGALVLVGGAVEVGEVLALGDGFVPVWAGELSLWEDLFPQPAIMRLKIATVSAKIDNRRIAIRSCQMPGTIQ